MQPAPAHQNISAIASAFAIFAASFNVRSLLPLLMVVERFLLIA